MNNKYPIQPKHLSTKEEPKGFDLILPYSQRILLWSFVQFWQSEENWNPFKMKDFLNFLDSPKSRRILNRSIQSGVAFFVESSLSNLLQTEGEGDQKIFHATHLMITTYFQWNPQL